MISKEAYIKKESDYYVYTPGALAKKLFLYPTIVGDFGYEPGYKLYRDAFDSFLCMYIKSGQCQISVGADNSKGEEGEMLNMTAIKGQIVLLDCYKPHAYGSDTAWEAVWFHFDGQQAREYFEAITAEKGNVLTLASTYRFEKNLERIYGTFKNGKRVNDATLNNWIVNIMTELLVSTEKREKFSGQNEIIEDVVSFMIENMDQNLSIEALAKRANLSPFYFTRVFKEETGFTPHDYILTTKINHARYLLATTGLSNKDICYQLGFSSESAFCTTFKKKTGQTPKEYRSLKNEGVDI